MADISELVKPATLLWAPPGQDTAADVSLRAVINPSTATEGGQRREGPRHPRLGGLARRLPARRRRHRRLSVEPERGMALCATRIVATTIAATTSAVSLLLLSAVPSSAVEEPPGSAILDPEDVDKLLDEPTAEVLELAIGLPSDLADIGGDLAQFSADVRPSNSDIRFTVLVDTAASLALSGAQLDLEDEGWVVVGGLTTGQGFTASRDSDGDDGNQDGFGEETLLVSVDEQPGGRVAVHYGYSPGVGVDLSSVTTSAFFTAIREAQVDETMAFESAALTVTLQPVTRSGGFGTSTVPPGVAFTGRYTTDLPNAERLVEGLDELCSRPGYTCTGDPLRSSPASGSAFLRLPSGGSGTLSIGPVADEDLAVVQFFVSFNLDTGLVITPGDAAAVVPDPDAVDTDAGALPPKAGTEDEEAAASPPGAVLPKESAGPGIGPAVLAGGSAAFLVVGGLLAALLIRRRRRRRAGELTEAEAPAVLEPGLAELARAALLAGAGFRPRVVQVADDRVEVLLTENTAALPDDWTATAELVWARSNASTTIDLDGGLVPQLVDLETGDGTRLAIDLEAEPCLNVLGEPDDTLAFVSRLAGDAETAGVEVYVITNAADLAAAAGVPATTFESWDEPWSHLAARSATVAGLLAEHGWPSVFAARAASPDHPGLRPVLVITDSTLPAGLVEVLGQLQWGTVAVVSLADSPGGTPLFVTDTELHLPTLGLCVDRATTVAGTGEPPALPVEDGGWERFEPTLAPGEVLLRLLGDIGVDGLDQLTAKPTAVLAYIAVHPGATVGRVVDACWPDTTMSSRRRQLGKIVTHLRTVLGKDLLPDAEGGRYRTGTGVIADINVFDDLVASSRDAGPAEEAGLLRRALDLVEGRPFTYPAAAEDAYTWVDDENLVATWERSIRETATRCAELLLELGRPDDAVAALTPVLAKVPGDTALTELLMTALAASGDRLSVQRVYQAHGRSLEKLNLVGAEESIDDLYERLVGNQ